MNTDFQVTSLVRTLGDLGSLLNPARLVGVVADAVRETAVPPPGDPDALDALAARYRSTAAALTAVAGAVAGLDVEPPSAWTRGVTTVAAEVVPATARALDRAPAVFTRAADALAELAASIRDQRRRHADLRQALRDAAYDATHVAGVPMPDPVGIARLVGVVDELIAGCVAVYTDSLIAADRAASRFADLRGAARAAAARGLAPDDAVVLADAMVGGFDAGALTPGGLDRAGLRLGGLGPRGRAQVDGVLRAAGSDLERAWLLKALGAGHDLGAFADAIRGRSPDWLASRLSLLDRGAAVDQTRLGVAVRQYEPTTCGTTCLIVARAEHDPRYALALTEGDFAANFRAERDAVHHETNRVHPEAAGTSPAGMVAYLDRHLGTPHDWRLVDDTDPRAVSATLREVVAVVDGGEPVPLLVGGTVPRHYVLVVGHHDGVLLVFEPTAGRTVAVPEHRFRAGDLKDTLAFRHVQAVMLPL
ncbi:hypothetical protein [Actinokineospora sp.]|uniref:hypothetical protein n=1 Tax=Actinokineospora sp. TaxID=1872133 RepID=UPI004037CCA9